MDNPVPTGVSVLANSLAAMGSHLGCRLECFALAGAGAHRLFDADLMHTCFFCENIEKIIFFFFLTGRWNVR